MKLYGPNKDKRLGDYDDADAWAEENRFESGVLVTKILKDNGGRMNTEDLADAVYLKWTAMLIDEMVRDGYLERTLDGKIKATAKGKAANKGWPT